IRGDTRSVGRSRCTWKRNERTIPSARPHQKILRCTREKQWWELICSAALFRNIGLVFTGQDAAQRFKSLRNSSANDLFGVVFVDSIARAAFPARNGGHLNVDLERRIVFVNNVQYESAAMSLEAHQIGIALPAIMVFLQNAFEPGHY